MISDLVIKVEEVGVVTESLSAICRCRRALGSDPILWNFYCCSK